MKNLIKFLFFVLLVSAGISALYDYRLKHGRSEVSRASTPEKYTLATNASVDPKEVAGLENLNRERRALVSSVVPVGGQHQDLEERSPIRRNSSSIPSSFLIATRGNSGIQTRKRWCKILSARG